MRRDVVDDRAHVVRGDRVPSGPPRVGARHPVEADAAAHLDVDPLGERGMVARRVARREHGSRDLLFHRRREVDAENLPSGPSPGPAPPES